MHAHRLAQQRGEAPDLERLGAERLHDAYAEERLLEAARELGEDRELRGGEATDRTADPAGHGPVQYASDDRCDDQSRARADEQYAIERDQQRRR